MRNPQLPVLSAELLERFFQENWGKFWRLQATHQEAIRGCKFLLIPLYPIKLELSRVCWGYDIYAFVYTCIHIIYNHRFSPPAPLWGLTPKYTSPKKTTVLVVRIIKAICRERRRGWHTQHQISDFGTVQTSIQIQGPQRRGKPLGNMGLLIKGCFFWNILVLNK